MRRAVQPRPDEAIDIDDNGYITRDEFDQCLQQEKFMEPQSGKTV